MFDEGDNWTEDKHGDGDSKRINSICNAVA